jgi:hypothetical protein
MTPENVEEIWDYIFVCHMCICWCHEWIKTSVYYISQNFALISGFSRHTTISSFVLCCATWLHISSNWWWCKQAYYQYEILLERACFLPVYSYYVSCFAMWVTVFVFPSFCHIILWLIYFTIIKQDDLTVGRTRYMLGFEELWLWRWDVMACNLVDWYKDSFIMRVDE